MFNIKYKKYILDLINERCPNIRKPSYKTEYYLDMILKVFHGSVSWSHINCPNKPKNHHSTVRKIYNKWVNLNIFVDAFNRALYENYIPILDEKNRLDLLIDSTLIWNLNGSESIGYGYRDKKKKVTKSSFIIDPYYNIPLCHVPFKGNISDTKTIIDSYCNLPTFIKNCSVNIIGDNGYLLNANRWENKFFKLNKINLIIPKRKNQRRKRLSKYKKSKLKERYKIEICIKRLKANNRIIIRKDKKIINYISFVYIGMLLILQNKLG